MKYTVVWKPRAQDQLAEIWLAAPNRSDVSNAANELDRILQHEPDTHGESRSENRRLVIVGALAVVIDIRKEDRIVAVVSVVPVSREF